MSKAEDFIFFHPLVDFSGFTESAPLIISFSGHTDNGLLSKSMSEIITEECEYDIIGCFAVDDFYNYQAERPSIVIDKNSYLDYQEPFLDLIKAKDTNGKTFYFLNGVEPHMHWNKVYLDIVEIINLLNIDKIIWLRSVAMPVPHTREIGSAVITQNVNYIQKWASWEPTSEIQAAFLSFFDEKYRNYLEEAFPDSNKEIVGFVLLSPHYLANVQFPKMAIASIERIESITNLKIPKLAVIEKQENFIIDISDKTDDNEEFNSILKTLEEKYDSYTLELKRTKEGDFDDLNISDDLITDLENYLKSIADEDN